MVRTVVATTDGSERSFRVFAHAARLAGAARLDLVVLHVLDDTVDRVAFPEEAPARVLRKQMEVRREIAAALRTMGVTADVHISVKPPEVPIARAILDAAVGLGAVTLAMESRGHNFLRTAMMGSTTLRLLSRAHIPVMVTDERVEAPGPSSRPYRILACTDGSVPAEGVVHSMTALTLAADMAVSVLRVHEDPEMLPAPETVLITDQLERWFPDSVPVRRVPQPHPPATVPVPEQILQAAADEGADAIAVSTHGYRLARRLLGGGVALTLLRHSPLPLLLGH